MAGGETPAPRRYSALGGGAPRRAGPFAPADLRRAPSGTTLPGSPWPTSSSSSPASRLEATSPAIKQLAGLHRGDPHQVLGITGSGKTFSIANVIRLANDAIAPNRRGRPAHV